MRSQVNRSIRKKVALLGAFGVGKTSLVGRFVHSMFSPAYHTTVGVKIDKKTVKLDGVTLTMMLWDMAGEDPSRSIQTRYLRGVSGYLLVADGTRPETLQTALDIDRKVRDLLGPLPRQLLINKADLVDDWALTDADIRPLEGLGLLPWTTSALSGEGVEAAFLGLGQEVIGR